MTVQSILILAGIVSAFLTFGVVLAGADFYTQRGRKPGAEIFPVSEERSSTGADERRAA